MQITTRIYLNFLIISLLMVITYLISRFSPTYLEWAFVPTLIFLALLFWQIHTEMLIPAIILEKKARVFMQKKQHWNLQTRLIGFFRPVNQLIKNLTFQLEKAQSFVQELKKGNLEVDFRESEIQESPLFTVLEQLRDNLIHIEEEKNKRNWANEGLSRFVDILQNHRHDLKSLCDHITSECAEYLKMNQAWLYVVQEDEANSYLELCSSYAWDRKKFLKKRIEAGEGLAGQVLFEKKRILLTRIPQDYLKVSSGCGEANPGCILILPLKVNDEMFGVLELVSFQIPEDFQIQFLDELAENIALTISAIKTADNTHKLLEKAQHQAEELKAQEEELRQNMEELQSIQEKLTLEREEQEKLSLALEEEKNLFNAFLNTTSDQVYFKDRQSRFIRVSECMAAKFGVNTAKELIGKSDFDLFGQEHARQAFKDEQHIIRSGLPLLEVEEKETWLDGSITWVHTSKLPLKNIQGEIVGTFGISRNITERKTAEEALSREKKMLDAFLFNTPHLVFFKSAEGQFIRASQSFAQFMGHTNIHELIGKNESDYFSPQSAQNIAEKDEQVIRKGQAAISQLIKEQFANGKSIEMLTHRFPISSNNGEPLGIFGIYEPVNKPLFKQN
ncbi:MAG: PAS domain S-box protein [Microscillaceae bacterium]|nr:PAS domain S-box protein [Microscillaceae bacterium]